MLAIPEAMTVQAHAAAHKVAGVRAPLRFIVSGMLAGAFVGVAVVLMVTTAGPLLAEGSGSVKLVSGAVFGVALTLVVFAGGELSTSSMMTLTQGTLMRAVRVLPASGTLLLTFASNLLGALVFGALVSASGILHSNAPAGDMLKTMLEAKAHEGVAELFVRGILCNALVCLAIWMCARLTSDGAKLVVIFWALLAFIASGFEHVVANMTTYAIGITSGYDGATWALFGHNLLWVGPGNMVGGALLIGTAYWFVAGSPRQPVDARDDVEIGIRTPATP